MFALLLAAPLLAAAAPAALPKDCDDCAVLAVVPAGSFRMGAEGGEEGRPEGPVHDRRKRVAGLRFVFGALGDSVVFARPVLVEWLDGRWFEKVKAT